MPCAAGDVAPTLARNPLCRSRVVAEAGRRPARRPAVRSARRGHRHAAWPTPATPNGTARWPRPSPAAPHPGGRRRAARPAVLHLPAAPHRRRGPAHRLAVGAGAPRQRAGSEHRPTCRMSIPRRHRRLLTSKPRRRNGHDRAHRPRHRRRSQHGWTAGRQGPERGLRQCHHRRTRRPRGRPVARRGVPQGRHAHGLLARGREVLEDFFPGLTDELVGLGAAAIDLQGGFRWINGGRLLRQEPSGLLGRVPAGSCWRPACGRACWPCRRCGCSTAATRPVSPRRPTTGG